MNADSTSSPATFTLMKDCILKMINRFGVYRFHYSVIIFGTTSTTYLDFGTSFPYREALITRVNALVKQGGSSGILDALGKANTIYSLSSVRSNSVRGLAVILDKPTGKTIAELQNAVKPINEKGVIITTSGIVGEASYDELQALTLSKYNAIRPKSSYSSTLLADFFVRNIRQGKTSKSKCFGAFVQAIFKGLSFSDFQIQLTSWIWFLQYLCPEISMKLPH